jgi:hypothetical protein
MGVRHFTRDEVIDLTEGGGVQEEEIERLRWTMTMETIVKVDDKYYRIEWEQGLTEGQDNVYRAQDAEEVKQVEVTKVVKKWVSV